MVLLVNFSPKTVQKDLFYCRAAENFGILFGQILAKMSPKGPHVVQFFEILDFWSIFGEHLVKSENLVKSVKGPI